MDEIPEKNTSHIRCEDELALQKLLDEELDPDASELVFHHLGGCQRCGAVFEHLKQLKSFCQEQMGYEDEVEADFSHTILSRVRIQIESARRSLPAESVSPSGQGTRLARPQEMPGQSTREDWFQPLRKWFRPGPADWSFWLRPGVVTTALAVISVAIGLTLWLRVPSPVSAAELFHRAIRAEEAMAGRTDAVLHRAINVEERQGTSRALVARRRLDIWQSAERGITALRLYDEKGRLIAGEWRRANEFRTIYRRNSEPELQPEAVAQVETPIGPDNVWQLEPSAKSFSSLIKHPDRASVEEKATTYVIRCGGDATEGARGIMRATLVLSRADYRALEQTLVVEQGGEAREYRFIETSFEQRPTSAVPLAVFEPEPELLGPNPGLRVESPTKQPEGASEPEPLASAVATTELEIKVLDLLNGIGADIGQEVNVTRTPKGQLQVQAAVETDRRKGEILRALAPVADEPAVILQVETTAEAARRIARSRRPAGPQGGQAEVAGPTITARDAIPVHDQVRRYLLARGTPEERVDAEIGRVAARTLRRSNQALLRALALKNLAYRFSREDLRTIESDARAKWLTMLGAHAQAVGAESVALRQELSAIFGVSVPAPERMDQIEVTDEASLTRAVAHLADLASANDEAIRLAFSISAEATSARVTGAQFWRQLTGAADLAAKIHKATERLKSSTQTGQQ